MVGSGWGVVGRTDDKNTDGWRVIGNGMVGRRGGLWAENGREGREVVRIWRGQRGVVGGSRRRDM